MFKHKNNSYVVGIDARFYGPIGKGLGRYTQEIVDNVIKISESRNDNIKYVIFLSSDNFLGFECSNKNVKKICLNIGWYSWKEQIIFPFYIWKERVDLMHFPHFNVPILTPTKFVVTIHDLILTHFPTMRATTLGPVLYKLKNIAYHLVIKTAIKRAKYIVTVSNFTKNDIIDKFKVNNSKIKVIYEGIANLAMGRDNLFTKSLDQKEVLHEFHINHDYLLYVGNAYPHKNLEILIRVFSKLLERNKNLRLILVGKHDYFYNRIMNYARSLNLWQEGNINNPVIFTGYVSDIQLDILYKNAKAYIFPSLYEGFGLPPLEAIARGCLVLSSNRSSLPEILGAGAIYFDPENEENLLEKIENVLDNEELKRRVLLEGKQLIKKYNWWECARKTLDIYISCL